jgi:hypothetical protein
MILVIVQALQPVHQPVHDQPQATAHNQCLRQRQLTVESSMLAVGPFIADHRPETLGLPSRRHSHKDNQVLITAPLSRRHRHKDNQVQITPLLLRRQEPEPVRYPI